MRLSASCALLAALVLVTGCSQQGRGPAPPTGPAPQPPVITGAVTDDAWDGEGVTPGVYELTDASLPTPWVRTVAGFLPWISAGEWDGTLWRIGHDLRAVVGVTGRGEGAVGTLRLAPGGKLQGKAVESSHAEADGPETTRLTFPPVSAQGKDVSLVVEVSHLPQGGARVFVAQDACREAHVRVGQEKQVLRFISDPGETRPETTVVWFDADGDGESAEWEVATLSTPVGIMGKLRRFHLDVPEKGKLTVEQYPGAVGVVQFDATDGRGQRGGVYAPFFYTSDGAIHHLGEVTVAEAPTGSAQLTYGLPVSAGALGLATVTQALNIPAEGAVQLKAGGPVEIAVTATGDRQGTLQAQMRLTTESGHMVGGFTGPGDSAGVVEFLDPQGNVLATGKAEFG